MFCPRCGVQQAGQGRFCERCGANLGNAPVRRGGEDTALMIGKFAALITLAAFLLLPQVGCGASVVNGWDLLFQYHVGWFIKLLCVLVVLGAIGVASSKRASEMTGGAILGLVGLFVILLRFKLEANQQGLGSLVEIKPGALISVGGFVAALCAAKWAGGAGTATREAEQIGRSDTLRSDDEARR